MHCTLNNVEIILWLGPQTNLKTVRSPPVGFLDVRVHGQLSPECGVARGWWRRPRGFRPLAGFAISDEHGHGDPPGTASTTASCGLYSLRGRAFRLVPVILEPYLHLGGRQPDYRGQVLAFRGAEVALLTEPALELVGLGLGEQDPSLALLVLRLVRVGTVLARALDPRGLFGVRVLSLGGRLVVVIVFLVVVVLGVNLLLLELIVVVFVALDAAVVAAAALRRVRQVGYRWTRRVWLLEYCNDKKTIWLFNYL